MPAWYEDDALWESLRGAFFTEDRWESAKTEVEQIVERLRLPPCSRVLDLGCGPGRHTLHFARLGFRVTAVDRTLAYLAEARERAAAENLDIEFVHCDMREFRRPEAFHLTVNLLTSFGYFEDQQDDRRVLENIHEGLVPGGRLVLDIFPKEILAKVYQPKYWTELAEGSYWLEEREIEADWALARVRWIFLHAGQKKEFCFSHRLYSGVELRDLARSAGFAHVELSGNLAGRPFDRSAERLVVVAAK